MHTNMKTGKCYDLDNLRYEKIENICVNDQLLNDLL